MKPIKNNLIFKLLIVGFVAIVLTVNINARVFNNGAGNGYDEGDGSASIQRTLSKEITIESLIISGANFYQWACIDMQKFLNLYENQDEKGSDFMEWHSILNNALANMENAVNTYDRLIQKAEVTPYNETVRERLMAFDYTGFMEENGLVASIFQIPADFLKSGDITGLLRHMHTKLKMIKEMVNALKEDVSMNKVPVINAVWNINEAFSTLSLMGSYISRVFYENR